MATDANSASSSQPHKSAKAEISPLPRAIFVCFGVLGMTIGLYVGMSESPIAATIVGSLFGLAGAGGVFSLLTKTDESSLPPQRIKDVGMAISLLCALSIIGSLFGIGIRNGAIPELISPASPTERLVDLSADLDALSVSQHAKLIMLQTRLNHLGVSVRENNAIVSKLRATATSEGSQSLTNAAVAKCLKNADELLATSEKSYAKSRTLAKSAERSFEEQRKKLEPAFRNDVDAALDIVRDQIVAVDYDIEGITEIAKELKTALKVVDAGNLTSVNEILDAYEGKYTEPTENRTTPTLNRRPHRSWGIKP